MVPAGAVREGRFKLIEWYEGTIATTGRDFELFDLESDLSERRNIIDSNPDPAKRLKAALDSWRQSVNAQMPTLNTDRTQH